MVENPIFYHHMGLTEHERNFAEFLLGNDGLTMTKQQLYQLVAETSPKMSIPHRQHYFLFIKQFEKKGLIKTKGNTRICTIHATQKLKNIYNAYYDSLNISNPLSSSLSNGSPSS